MARVDIGYPSSSDEDTEWRGERQSTGAGADASLLSSDEDPQRSEERSSMWGAYLRWLSGALLLAVLVGVDTAVRLRDRPAAVHASGTQAAPVPEGLESLEGLQGDPMPSLNLAPGIVAAVYTYGAPGTADPPLVNFAAKDGCFSGLRSYNEDVLTGVTHQVDAAAISNAYKHAKMSSVVLHASGDSIYTPCPGNDNAPNDADGTVFAEWRLHWENDYQPRLRKVQVAGKDESDQEPFVTASKFVLFAYKSYDSTKHTIEQVGMRLPGWTLVARETRIEGTGTLYDEDPVMLLQEADTLNCALVFTGTNNLGNEIATSTTSFMAGYCGFEGVHDGYRNELWHITKELWPRLRPKLSKCNQVACVGHSLGGSLCDIFAACANSKRMEDPDYQQQMWVRGKPELMPRIEKGGMVYLPGAEVRCEEPPCPK
uniref:Uncharacterized protein n=1 Tax=Zooxanthella nutricula TaxID=1333877 RepID=A0A7S2NYA6_9DINO